MHMTQRQKLLLDALTLRRVWLIETPADRKTGTNRIVAQRTTHAHIAATSQSG